MPALCISLSLPCFDGLNIYPAFHGDKYCMRIFEIQTPKSPEQQKLAQLKANRDRASQAVKQEQDRQKRQRAQKTLQSLNKNKSTASQSIKPIGPV